MSALLRKLEYFSVWMKVQQCKRAANNIMEQRKNRKIIANVLASDDCHRCAPKKKQQQPCNNSLKRSRRLVAKTKQLCHKNTIYTNSFVFTDNSYKLSIVEKISRKLQHWREQSTNTLKTKTTFFQMASKPHSIANLANSVILSMGPRCIHCALVCIRRKLFNWKLNVREYKTHRKVHN